MTTNATSVEPKDQTPLYVYVIESPSAVDGYHKFSEAELIESACSLMGVNCFSRKAFDENAFKAAIKDFKEKVLGGPAVIPILHISAHGNSRGIGMTGGKFIPWAELKNVLAPVNEALRGLLILCMSSCEGLAASQMAMSIEDKDHPFFAMIGSSGEPTWSETAVAYQTLYLHLQKGHAAFDAVQAMCRASDNKSFFLSTAKEARDGFIEYLKKTSSPTTTNVSTSVMLPPPPLSPNGEPCGSSAPPSRGPLNTPSTGTPGAPPVRTPD